MRYALSVRRVAVVPEGPCQPRVVYEVRRRRHLAEVKIHRFQRRPHARAAANVRREREGREGGGLSPAAAECAETGVYAHACARADEQRLRLSYGVSGGAQDGEEMGGAGR